MDVQALVEDELPVTDDRSSQPDTKISRASTMLRRVGASVLIAAAAAFLLQQFDSMSDVMRFASFLAFTLSLGTFGLLCGVKLGDDKGARTFLGVAAVLVPANFTHLGAIIYAVLNPVPRWSVPHWAIVNVTSVTDATLTVAIGIALLVPLTTLAFRVLARSEALKFTLIYLGASSVLLIPTRDPSITGYIALWFVTALLVAEAIREHQGAAVVLKTSEGKMVRAMMFIPALLLVSRTVYLYPVTQAFVASMVIAVGMLHFWAGRYCSDKNNGLAAETMGSIIAAFGSILLGNSIADQLGLRQQWACLTTLMPPAFVFLAAALGTIGTGRNYRRAAGVVAVCVPLLSLMFYGDMYSSLLVILTSLIAATLGYSNQEKGPFVVGTFGLVAGVGYQLRFALEYYHASPWVTLGMLGVVLVFLSSLVERNKSQVLARLSQLKTAYTEWQ